MCHCLIIEDEFLIADHLAQLVKEAGATSIDYAETEAGAVACAKARRPDIIVSDVHLLGGHGPNAVSRILHDLGHIAVMFVTSSPEDCTPCGTAAVVIRKPFQSRYFIDEFTRLAPAA